MNIFKNNQEQKSKELPPILQKKLDDFKLETAVFIAEETRKTNTMMNYFFNRLNQLQKREIN